MTKSDPIILLVDDCENDAFLMCTVFDRAGLGRPLRFARDGDQAIAYLRGDGIYGDRQQYPFPAAVLLDLNMPGKNGFEVLIWIRQQEAFKHLRVYMLSASSRPADVRRASELGANSYLVKPGNLEGLMHLAKSLVAWLQLCQFTTMTDTNTAADASTLSPAPVGRFVPAAAVPVSVQP